MSAVTLNPVERSIRYRREGCQIIRKLAKAGFVAGEMMPVEDLAEELGLTTARVVHVVMGLKHNGVAEVASSVVNGVAFVTGVTLLPE